MSSFFPLFTWDHIDDSDADRALEEWGHWLGGCDRPFGRISYGLHLGKTLVSVAVSASTAGTFCADFNRYEVVELARLCSHPDHRDLTRVALRLWRKTADRDWARYWPVVAYVSYANAVRHSGDIYRFDGWKKAKFVRGGVCTSTTGHQKTGTQYDPKWIWVYDLNISEEQRNEWCQARHDAVESARAEKALRVSRRLDGGTGGSNGLLLFPEWDTPAPDGRRETSHRPAPVDSHRD